MTERSSSQGRGGAGQGAQGAQGGRPGDWGRGNHAADEQYYGAGTADAFGAPAPTGSYGTGARAAGSYGSGSAGSQGAAAAGRFGAGAAGSYRPGTAGTYGAGTSADAFGAGAAGTYGSGTAGTYGSGTATYGSGAAGTYGSGAADAYAAGAFGAGTADAYGSGTAGAAAAHPGELPTGGMRHPAPPETADAKGFIAALFDFGFTSFVTPKVIKVLYVLIMIGTMIGALAFTVTAFQASAVFGIVTLVIGVPLFILIVMAVYRIILELFIVIFRIAEDIRALRERGDIG